MNEYGAINPTLKTGRECLKNEGRDLSVTLYDFWRWSVSDILSNATRGIFAEFIVATACGVDLLTPRDEWGVFDLTTPDGIKVEVKSSAFIQSWPQKKLPTVSFSTKLSRGWDYETGSQSKIKSRHADVYVFCLLANKDQSTVDPLDMRQWQFYVLAVTELNNYERSQHSITLPSLERLTSKVSYQNLHSEIKRKNLLNR